jgi:heme exporter protein B
MFVAMQALLVTLQAFFNATTVQAISAGTAVPVIAPLTALAARIGGRGFAFTGALGAALALGAKRGGLLIAVVVLPLFIPPVVFGSGALDRAAAGLSSLPALALLSAYVLFAVVIAPLAGAAAIRNAQG